MMRPLRPSPSVALDRMRQGGSASAAVWRQLSRFGGPLVEMDPTDLESRLVTFLWRDGRLDGEVLLLLNGVTDRDRQEHQDVSAHLLDRLPNSDFRYSTYRFPADLRASYQLYPCERVPDCDRRNWLSVVRGAVPDPLNRRQVRGAFDTTASLLELPDAPSMEYAWPREGVPAGRVDRWVVGDRAVWSYLPPGHDRDAGPYPVVVLLDGDVWAKMPIAPTFDNLIAEDRLPPVVAVMPDSLDSDARWRDLTCNEEFVRYLSSGVLEWAAEHFGITDDPDRTVIAGQSLGGLAAAHAGLVASDRFGNALCQSGSYYWPEDNPMWLPNRFAEHAAVPVRFFLQVGRHEPMLTECADYFEDVLLDKNYQVTRRDFTGGHDYVCWQAGMADGLIELADDW